MWRLQGHSRPPRTPPWVYEGKWGSYGSGNGQFDYPFGVALNAASCRAYVGDILN